MHYYTRLEESPNRATLAMLTVNENKQVEVVPMEDRYGRSVAVRVIRLAAAEDGDSVYVCAGDNPLFIASVIVLAHAHNSTVAARRFDRPNDGC